VDLFPTYRKSYLRLDPVTEAYRATPHLNNVVVQRVRPSHIDSQAFRRRVFEDAGIVERISVIQRGADSWRVISVATHASSGRFTDTQISCLVGLACQVVPMLPLNRVHPPHPDPLTVGQMEQRFADCFGALPQREREVCARAAAGMGVEASALDLGIAKTSVLTYRRRAYQRLGVNSPVALRALVTH
jgi:DNA-binding CsgD family transcriptional regulator